MRMIEPMSAYFPYMTCPGNHGTATSLSLLLLLLAVATTPVDLLAHALAHPSANRDRVQL